MRSRIGIGLILSFIPAKIISHRTTYIVYPESRVIKRIVIQNFMAHKSTSLELARGVTVITGPNNTGKSAIVEAIRSIAQNPPSGRTAIRHGEKSAVVRAELESGEFVEWERTDKTSVYRIRQNGENGTEPSTETYAKFGRTPPEDVRGLLRLDSVETETGPVDIHIGNQRYPIFLLDQSGSQAASFFAASTEAEYLLRMQQALKSRTDRNKARHKELARQCAEMERQLERLKPLDALAVVLGKAELLHRMILEEEKSLPLLESFLENLGRTLSDCSIKSRASSLLSSVTAPPVMDKTEQLEELAEEIQNRAASLEFLRSKKSTLAVLGNPPVVLETRPLDELVASISGAVEGHERASALTGILDRVAVPPEILEVQILNSVITSVDEASIRIKILGNNMNVLEGALSPPSLVEVAEMTFLLADLSRTGNSHKHCLLQAEKLDILPVPPALSEVGALSAVFDSIRQVSGRLGKTRSQDEILTKVSAPPEIEETEALQELTTGIERCRLEAEASAKAHRIASNLLSPPELSDPLALETLTNSISRLEVQFGRIEQITGVHESVNPPPQIFPTHDLSDLLDRVSSLQGRMAEAEQLRSEAENSMLLKKKEIEQAIAEAGKCPLCGHMLDLEHFLEVAHV